MKDKILLTLRIVACTIIAAIAIYASYSFISPIVNPPVNEEEVVAEIPGDNIEQPQEKTDENMETGTSSASDDVNDTAYMYLKTGYKMMGIQQA